MPNIKSAMTRVRTSEKARQRNIAVNASITTMRRKLFETTAKKEKDACVQVFKAYCSVLDKAAKKGIIKRNTAIRRKRRAALKLAALA